MAKNIEIDERLTVSNAMDVFWDKGHNSSCTIPLAMSTSFFVKAIKNCTESRLYTVRKLLQPIKSPLKAIAKFINASAYTIRLILSGIQPEIHLVNFEKGQRHAYL